MSEILIYTSDIVGKQMAGPGIRAWEFACQLSKKFKVALIAKPKEIQEAPFRIISDKDPNLKQLIRQAKILIGFAIPFQILMTARKYGVRIILDSYCPYVVETLERLSGSSSHQSASFIRDLSNTQNFSLRFSDSYICASEKQKDFWLGHLLSLNILDAPRYQQYKEDFNILIDTVPFGLPASPPKKKGEGIREKFHLKADDKILLWGGGIWNWFDPLTLLRAVEILSRERGDIKLVFMGVKHPNDLIPEMEMCAQTIHLAKKLNLLDRFVFFNYGWVPYEQRQNFLLDATIGISTHFSHLETRFSFRTRILDYLWAGLPIIATEGDYFGELIKTKQLGITVPPEDPQSLSEAIKTIADQPNLTEEIRKNIAQVRPNFYWENIVKPLESMVEYYLKLPQKRAGWNDYYSIFYYLLNKKGKGRIFKEILGRKLKKLFRLNRHD